MEKRRYRLLIADDEYWTREKIRTMIAWEEYRIDFMPPAQDGEEVMQMLESDRPDILITDINMPFLNGVELVKRVKEQYPEIVILVLSGYDDFAYVKDTLVAGAINYLLKPVSKIDLIGAVSKALELISEKEENERQTLKAASLLQDRELSLLIEKERVRLSVTQVTGTVLDSVGCSIMLVKIHDLQTLMSRYQYDMNYLSYSIKKKLRETDTPHHHRGQRAVLLYGQPARCLRAEHFRHDDQTLQYGERDSFQQPGKEQHEASGDGMLHTGDGASPENRLKDRKRKNASGITAKRDGAWFLRKVEFYGDEADCKQGFGRLPRASDRTERSGRVRQGIEPSGRDGG